MKRLRLTLAYDGTAYAGWQAQPSGHTVQQTLQRAIAAMSGETVVVHGSGRTDAGVHARAQETHFDTDARFTPEAWHRGLNALLPPDIRVNRVRPTTAGFHARRDALCKEYRYLIWNREILPPFLRFYRTHVVKPLDVAAMRAAAGHLTGRHDFSAFSANPNREVPDATRTLSLLEVSHRNGEIVIRAISEGFLYKMVRSLAGHLIRVGCGSVSIDETPVLLASRQRTARVQTAPAQGLFLWRVEYPRRRSDGTGASNTRNDRP